MLTASQTTAALTEAFNAGGIDTAEKVKSFINIAALQVKKNSLLFEAQRLNQTQQLEVIAQEQARAAKQDEINATDLAILAALAAAAVPAE